MKSPRFWIAVFVAGVVLNALDFVVQGKVLADAYFSKMESARQNVNPGWFVLGDFAAVFVLAWVLNRVRSSFGPTLKDGIMAGLVLGVFANFPTWHFIGLMFKGVPYTLVWVETLFGVIWYALAGAILTAILKPSAPATAAPQEAELTHV